MIRFLGGWGKKVPCAIFWGPVQACRWHHLWSGFFSRFVVYCIGIAVCLLQQALRLRKSVHFRFHCFKGRAGIECQAWNRSRLRGQRAWFGRWNFVVFEIDSERFCFWYLSVGLAAGADWAPCSIQRPYKVQQVYNFHSRCALASAIFHIHSS